MSDYHIEVTGQVTIVPCAGVTNPISRWTILIMGPTGAGKSTLIEALTGAGDPSLGISKNQLSGFTQNVSCFELQNAVVRRMNTRNTYPIYLVDTPGFSDSKLSELEIINKVKRWIKSQNIGAVNNILYVTPITDTRIPGSKRRTIKMLQSLLHDSSASTVTIVTSMWDQVINAPAKERAEAHFKQLQDDIWKDLVDKGALVVRFHNDHTSAIDILQNIIKLRSPGWKPPFDDEEDPSAPLLYEELLDRISNARQEIESLRVDHLQLIAHPDPLMESCVGPRLLEVQQDLAKFLGQILDFGKPPPGFEDAPERIVHQHMLDHVEHTRQDIAAFKNAKTQALKRDWIRRSQITLAIRKAESRLSDLSIYLDARGNPQVPLDYEGVMEVLELLRPKVKTPFTERVKEELTSLTKKLNPH